MKFLKKRKADKIQKLKTKIIDLEDQNDILEHMNNSLERKVYYYKLKYGEVEQPPKRRMMKVMGNRGTTHGGAD